MPLLSTIKEIINQAKAGGGGKREGGKEGGVSRNRNREEVDVACNGKWLENRKWWAHT